MASPRSVAHISFWPIIIAVTALSLIYVFLLRLFPARSSFHIRLQLSADVLLITWLVWMTDPVRSPYAALYIVGIALAGIYLGARDALITSIGCSFCYTLITLLVVFNLVNPYGFETATILTSEATQKIGLNNIAFFVVGLLAARLAEQRSKSDYQLIAATHALANLRALHERVIESMRSGVITTDLQGQIFTLNPAAEEITGYLASELRGQSASVLFGDLSQMIKESLSAAEHGEIHPRFSAECLKPDGARLHLGFSIVPLFSENGETSGLVITFQDLTEVRLLEEANRRQDRLAAVGRVAAGIAHEIRNPLAAMSGSIQVLRDETNYDPSAQELMEIVLRESDRLNRIITDFLTYARPRPYEFLLTDLREPLRDTFTLLRNSPEIHPAHLLIEDLPAHPVIASADPAQLRQVFWNLSRNALEAMPDGGTLRVSMHEPPPGQVQINFSDTGCGMTEEQIENMFEPFTSTKPRGTGLGLSIVYQIVQDHHGTIKVRSHPGTGTTITIELSGRQQNGHTMLKDSADG